MYKQKNFKMRPLGLSKKASQCLRRIMSWILEKLSKRIKVVWFFSNYEKSNTKTKIIVFSIQKSSTPTDLFTENLIKKLVASRDELKLMAHFGIFDLSELSSTEKIKWLLNWILQHKCKLFEWELDVRNQACSYGEIWDWIWRSVETFCHVWNLRTIRNPRKKTKQKVFNSMLLQTFKAFD